MTLTNRVEHRVALVPVQRAIAQRNASETRHGVLQVSQCIEGFSHRARRGRIEPIRLGFHGAADSRISSAGVALRDESPYAPFMGRRKQRIGALGPEAIRQRETLLELSHVEMFERSRLVNDRVRFCLQNGAPYGMPVKKIDLHRQRA